MSGVLEEAKVEPSDVDEVVLVGGSTRIPILRQQISDAFSGKVRYGILLPWLSFLPYQRMRCRSFACL